MKFFVPGTNPGSGTQVRDYSGNRLNDAVTLLTDLSANYTRGRVELFGTYRYTGDRAANRPNTVTIPGYSEVNGGVSYRMQRTNIVLQVLNAPYVNANFDVVEGLQFTASANVPITVPP